MAESQNRWIIDAAASSLPSPLLSTCRTLDNQLEISHNPSMPSIGDLNRAYDGDCRMCDIDHIKNGNDGAV
jgi:hypothetical protein